jgi:hypothetical protein
MRNENRQKKIGNFASAAMPLGSHLDWEGGLKEA